MSSSSPNPFRRSLKFVEQWYRETPQRALDGAYEAARAIEEIEKNISKVSLFRSASARKA